VTTLITRERSRANAHRCLVLGGSGYVGSAVCRALASRGMRVAFTYWKNEASANALGAELPGSISLRADLMNFAQATAAVNDAAQALGGLDALIQCVGTAGDPSLYVSGASGKPDRFLAITESGWSQMMDLTAKSTFAACQAATRAMGEDGGQIVVVCSMDGVKSVPSPVHYASGKGALVAMVRALAKELGKRRILVNMLAPGILDGGVARLLSDDLRQEYVKHCSLKRTGSAAEIAQFVAWLVAENTYVTGQSILLDGGL
jgi:NAD(P)-dependent dehydrogenase (short-subunit alcohol dehydrogenase family)